MDMPQQVEKISAKQAIEFAFGHFRELFSDASIDHELLEEVEFLESDNEWRVVIGFDAGRVRHRDGSPLIALGGGSEPIREYRKIFVDAHDGSLVRIK